MEDISIYWKKKIKRVAKISKEMDFPEQNEEFWKTQVAGVISLIDELKREKDELELKLLKLKLSKRNEINISSMHFSDVLDILRKRGKENREKRKKNNENKIYR